MTDLEKLALLPGEEEAIETVLRLAKTHGYGNLIGHLQRAWQAKLMSGGLGEEAAKLGSFDCLAWERNGRIKGLEEELALHRESACHHLSEYRRHSRGRLGGAEEPEVHRALASHYMYHARRIRARIQELEDEK